MGLLKQDHNAIKLDLRAAVVLYPKRLSKNGQFKPVCGHGVARARPRMQYWKSLCIYSFKHTYSNGTLCTAAAMQRRGDLVNQQRRNRSICARLEMEVLLPGVLRAELGG